MCYSIHLYVSLYPVFIACAVFVKYVNFTFNTLDPNKVELCRTREKQITYCRNRANEADATH